MIVRTKKGSSLLAFPNRYVVVDIETTGLSPIYDEVIEIGALKIEDGNVIGTYQQLINPNCFISPFIKELTGITNEMLEGQPTFTEIAYECYSFLEGEILVGHNVHFDLNFLYDRLEENGYTLSNNFVDLLRISRRLSKELPNHKLSTIASFFEVDGKGAHRALKDCEITYQCFEKYRQIQKEKKIELISFPKSILSKRDGLEDETSPFYHRYCCFTGTLERMKRKEAMQKILDIGGYLEEQVTSHTDYLILGEANYQRQKGGSKSSKLRKAEQLILEGQELKILPESEFYRFIEKEEP